MLAMLCYISCCGSGRLPSSCRISPLSCSKTACPFSCTNGVMTLAAEFIVIKLQDSDVHVRRAALAALCNKRAAGAVGP